jgi:hypothetical protein
MLADNVDLPVVQGNVRAAEPNKMNIYLWPDSHISPNKRALRPASLMSYSIIRRTKKPTAILRPASLVFSTFLNPCSISFATYAWCFFARSSAGFEAGRVFLYRRSLRELYRLFNFCTSGSRYGKNCRANMLPTGVPAEL